MKNNFKAILPKRYSEAIGFYKILNCVSILLVILILFLTNEINAQDLNIDSIKVEAAKIEDPGLRGDFFNECINNYPNLDSASTFFIAESLIEIAQIADSLATKTVVGNELKARYYQLNRKFEKSCAIREESIRYMNEHVRIMGKDHPKHKIWKKMITGLNMNLGIVYNSQIKYDKAILKLEDALKLSEEMGLDNYVQKILSDMGGIYHSLGDYETAVEYLLKSVNIKGQENSLYCIQSYKELGSIFGSKRKDVDKAKFYHTKACTLSESIEDPNIELYKNIAYAGLHVYYYGIDDHVRADSVLQILEDIAKRIKSDYRLFFSYLRQAEVEPNPEKQDYYLEKAKKINYRKDNHMMASMYSYSCKIAVERNNFIEARKFGEKSLAQNTVNGSIRYIERDNETLSDICYELKDYKASRDYLKTHLTLKDSLMNEKIAQSQDVLNVKYETAKKENEINKLKNNELENRAQITKQRNLLTGSLGGITLVGLLAGSLFQNYKKEKQSNLALSEKNQIIKTKSDQNELLLKEIHHRVKNNLQTISSLLYLQSSSIQDEDAKDAIAIGQQRVESMALIHKNLYQRDNLAAIEMKEYITKLTKNLGSSYEGVGQQIAVNINMQELELDVDKAIPLGLIINEVITNCYKYAFVGKEDGLINISITEIDTGQKVLKVQDNGPGKEGTSNGFGTSLIQLLSKQIEGEISEDSNNGYTFELIF